MYVKSAFPLLVLATLIGQTLCSLLEEEPGTEFRQACKRKRTEIAFPIIRDASGVLRLDDASASPESRDLLHVKVSWRRKSLEVILFKNQVTSAGTHWEWSEGNITLARSTNKSCFYQGYIKGHDSSYVALSTCGGLSGFLQTDTELLFVEPGTPSQTSSPEGPTHRQAHLLYTCEGRRSPTLGSHGQGISTARHQRRIRRAVRQPKYLEVKLVVDYSLWNTIGGKERTEDYVMTLMNIANTVFQHKSLGVDIRVVVTKLIFLESRESRRVQTRNRAMDTVNKFCAWSMAQIPRGQRMDYDIAILITKEQLGPSGYAPITGLCNPVRSCAAIVDEGFTTGFVIAHESAHVFGLFHDGHGNHCHGRKYQTSLMAPLVESRLNHFWWSECSKDRMKGVINYLHCLNNVPPLPKDHFPLDAPESIQPELGKPWSLEFQCRREFGQRYRLCGAFYNDPCNVLWCSASSHGLCRTKRGPPMPGSPCGSSRECRNGRCEYIGNERPINGHWGSWTRWSECSTDCGVGVKRRTRACNNPEPRYGGKQCDGMSDSWDTCVNESCKDMQDMRKGECTVWDSLQVRYGTHNWQPYEGQNDTVLCKQTCKSFYTAEVVTIDVDVMDGTPCSYTRNNSNVCVEGKCVIVGCDGKLNSTKIKDRCGMCGGDGSECKVVKGVSTVMVKSHNMYQRVMTIPSGARDIRLERMTRDKQFFALQDPRYGSHPLNGEKTHSKSTSMVINGAMFYYNRQNYTHNETITSPGPLFQELQLDFFPNSLRDAVNVSYQYTVHKSDFTLEKEKYTWKFDKWSSCSVTCGAGHQQIMHKCIDKGSKHTVAEENCQFTERPRVDKVPCRRTKCGLTKFNWAMLNEFTECNATCGQSGHQVQLFECELLHMADRSAETVSMESCDHLEKPHYPRTCKGPPCNTTTIHRWQVIGNWTECPCGKAKTQTRVVRCEEVVLEDGTEAKVTAVGDEICEGASLDRPEDSQVCDGETCPPLYRWIETGEYTDCSADCDEIGHQRSILGCEKVVDGAEGEAQSIEMVKGMDCWKNKVKRPPSVQLPCNGPPCVVFSYQWQATEAWTECQADCDEAGFQEREFQCQRIDHTASDEVTNVTVGMCGDIPPPSEETRDCTGGNCPLKWSVEEWSDCSVTCGRGKQYRTVFCGDKSTDFDDIRCSEKPPRTSRLCKKGPCPEMTGEDCKDQYSFCKAYKARLYRCQRPLFKRKCCATCEEANRGAANRRPRNALERYMMKRGLGPWARNKGKR